MIKNLIGARIIKTGIAVTITMFIIDRLQFEPAIFGAISAVINVQPSVYLTLKATKEQVIVHILGVIAGIIMGYLWGGNPWTMGITTVLLIVLLNRLNMKSGLLMGVVAAIFVLSSSSEQFFLHAYNRSAVVFIGLFVAMAVNITLFPPRYGKQLVEKIRQSNEIAVNYFCQAVHDFTNLENHDIPKPEERREQLARLVEECKVLFMHFRRERHSSGHHPFLSPDEWLSMAEKFMKYNESIMEKADQIYSILPERLERRLKFGSQPISDEFKSMLDILDRGSATVRRVNIKLESLICDKEHVTPEEFNESYWEELREAMEKWDNMYSGNYYLHALIEIGVVASEIRGVSREGKKIINEAVSKK